MQEPSSSTSLNQRLSWPTPEAPCSDIPTLPERDAPCTTTSTSARKTQNAHPRSRHSSTLDMFHTFGPRGGQGRSGEGQGRESVVKTRSGRWQPDDRGYSRAASGRPRGDTGDSRSRTASGRPCGDAGDSRARTASGRPCGDEVGDSRSRTTSGRPKEDARDSRARTASGRPCRDEVGDSGGRPTSERPKEDVRDSRARTVSGRPTGDEAGDSRIQEASRGPNESVRDSRVRTASGRPEAGARARRASGRPEEDWRDSRARTASGRPEVGTRARRASGRPEEDWRDSRVRTASGRPEGARVRRASVQPEEDVRDSRARTASGRPEEGARARTASGRPEEDGWKDSRARTASGRPRRGVVVGTSVWVRVWPNGASELLHIDRGELMLGLGLQARDFHIFDNPGRNQGCCILCRERCVVVDMAYIRGIIASGFMLIMLPKEDRLSVFLGRFKRRIGQNTDDVLPAIDHGVMPAHGSPSLIEDGPAALEPQPMDQRDTPLPPALAQERVAASPGGAELPFELRALAICLDEAAADVADSCRQLSTLVVLLVNKLAVLVRMDNLDRLKKLKQRLSDLAHFVRALCGCLEELLDDEAQVRQLCLGARRERRASADGERDGAVHADADADAARASALLESSFRYFDEAFGQLQELAENIAVTEAVVQIKLDTTRNRLLSVAVAFNGVSVINAFTMGMFGFFNVNLLPAAGQVLDNFGWAADAYSWRGLPPDGAGVPGWWMFLTVTLTTLVGCFLLLALLLGRLSRRGVLHL